LEIYPGELGSSQLRSGGTRRRAGCPHPPGLRVAIGCTRKLISGA